ncbi:MAG: hypothetical protein RI556_13050 [Hydrogenovibrio sp.]|uniref:hypothetical protein n=1 Tax=Hydrogenovibrio sp. TaxID=2065821 RepID=UPI00287033D8|nr:hypothetical protein [Hydrogenovibrio sp.]MDR9500098.1 hypothetical protein [Hydrogenovibrio sp.]
MRNTFYFIILFATGLHNATADSGLVLQGYGANQSTMEVSVGYGGQDNNHTFSSVYISYFETEDTPSVSGTYGEFSNEQTYQTTRIGFALDSFATDKPYTAGFFGYATKMDTDLIDRFGFGMSIGYGWLPAKSVKVSADIELMPGAFSNDWNDNVYLEYGAKLKSSYRFNQHVILNAQYRYNGIFLNESVFDKLYSNVGVGIQINFS